VELELCVGQVVNLRRIGNPPAALRRAALGIRELALFDLNTKRAETIAQLGGEIVRRPDGGFEIRVSANLEAAAQGADVVLNSISGRARDERIAIEHGLAGQETTGPVGAAIPIIGQWELAGKLK